MKQNYRQFKIFTLKANLVSKSNDYYNEIRFSFF